ncbi:MAG: hypothetical protein L0332_10415 [Chloroflexi bacterium]|nr:hypothetical protein [Chloroflexota bacterium]MCI0576080.1 hypothetical protein [Chloroflexota bacterium]MCI0647868.1 hypothetical protein [Chloroflexota bacterium]MCI0727119.1 hypothetical protein [Chloroflexota bacterium]
MKKGTSLLFCLALIIAACAAPTATGPETALTEPDTAAVELAAADEVEQETDARPGAAPAGIPVIGWNYPNHELVQIDPQSGEEIAGVTPIKLGRGYDYVLSPDGRTLAVIAYTTEDGRNGKLHLIDLAAWQGVETAIEIDKWTDTLAFSSDGGRLVIAYPGRLAGFNGQPENYIIVVVDVARQAIVAETTVLFAPKLVAFTPDDRSLVVYGGELAPEKDENAQPAHAALLNATDLSVTWEQLLPGILDGNYLGEEVANGEQAMIGWRPATALSPDKMTLYIVHADEDKLTTVDFAGRGTQTVEIRPAQTLLDRLLALTAGVAYAKYYDGTEKQAVISPDGSRLYVVGWTSDTTVSEDDEWSFDYYAHGLKVIDTASGAEIASLDLQASGVSLSADGRQLYVVGWISSNRPFTEVYDATSLELITRLPDRLASATQTLDGRPVLLSTTYVGNSTRLAVIDGVTLEELSTVVVGDYAQFLANQRLIGYIP